jgi:hypothetical protein
LNEGGDFTFKWNQNLNLPYGYFYPVGNMKLSKKGDLLVHEHRDNFSTAIMLYRFHESNGLTFIARIAFPNFYWCYFFEFSPDDKKLYAIVDDSTNPGPDYFSSRSLIQIDLSSLKKEDIEKSVVKIFSDAGESFGKIQLGPDCRIYIARNNKAYLGVINNPNAKGSLCNFVLNGFYLEGRMSTFSLPTYNSEIFNPKADFNWDAT